MKRRSTERSRLDERLLDIPRHQLVPRRPGGIPVVEEEIGVPARLEGQGCLELLKFTSRLSSLDTLGSYQLLLSPQGERKLALQLSTLDGALRLSGQGDIGAKGLRLRGEASAAPGQEAALNNLLNIIGRREGALSRLSIG